MNSDTIQETESLQRICAPLLAWYESDCRELEWRRNPLPYYVWISEIMLQQTRVEAVKPYFARFVQELPDVHALAKCDDDRLMKLWEGLGYYSRARNLKKAAQLIRKEHGGKLPADAGALKKLPGIGSYTAGAIASIAFGLPESAVDGNVLRVISRICASKACIDDPKVKAALEDGIRGFLRRETDTVPPGKFNQALMELGALVCLPNGAPACGKCPVRDLCEARKENLTGVIPVRRRKKERRVEHRTVLVIHDSSRLLIRRRPRKGLLAGLWELPNYDGILSQSEALREGEALGVSPLRIRPLPDAKHIFTHVEWEMTGYLILAEEMDGAECPAVETSRIEAEYSIPGAFSGYAAYKNTF